MIEYSDMQVQESIVVIIVSLSQRDNFNVVWGSCLVLLKSLNCVFFDVWRIE